MGPFSRLVTHCSPSWRFSASRRLFSWRRWAHSSWSPSASAGAPLPGKLLQLLACDWGLSWEAAPSPSARCTGSTLLLADLHSSRGTAEARTLLWLEQDIALTAEVQLMIDGQT